MRTRLTTTRRGAVWLAAATIAVSAVGVAHGQVADVPARPAKAASDRDAIRSELESIFEEGMATATGLPHGASRDEALAFLGCAKGQSGDVAAATRIAATISDLGERVQVLDTLADDRVKHGDLAGAKRTLGELEQAVAERAESVGADKAQFGMPSVVSLAMAQFRSGDLAGAMETIHACPMRYDHDEALGQVATAQAAAGDIADAKKTAAAIGYPESLNPTQVAIVGAQADRGFFAGARETMATIPNSDYRREALCEISAAQVASGDETGAKESLVVFTEPLSRASALLHLARAEVKAGNRGAALETVGEVRLLCSAQGDATEPWACSDYFVFEIAVAQAQAGDVAGAKRLLVGLDDPLEVTRRIVQIGAVQHGAGDLDGARETLEDAREEIDKAPDETAKYYGLCEVAEAQIAVGDVAGARDSVRGLRAAALRAEALGRVAAAQAKMGDSRGAEETFAEVLDAARKVDDRENREYMLWLMVGEEAISGDVVGAKSGVRTMSHSPFAEVERKDTDIKVLLGAFRADALADLTAAEVKSGDDRSAKATLGEARRAAMAFTDAEDRADHLAEIYGMVAKALAARPNSAASSPAPTGD